MKDKAIVVGLVVSLAIGVVGLFSGDTVVTNPTVEKIVKEVVGASSGPDHRQGVEYFYDGLADGGGVLSTSTAASGSVAGTLTAAQLQKNNVIRVMINAQAGMTLTLPATSTAQGVLPEAGMHRTWIIENATSTAAATLTVAAGSGINLISVTTNDDVIDGTERMVLDCFRRLDTDWDCRVDELLNSD